MIFKKKICLALGGGGARGICYLGLLKVFEDHGLIPDMIVGTSMGSIVGGAFCQRKYPARDLIDRFKTVLYSRKFEDLGFSLIESLNKHTYLGFIKKLKNAVAKLNFYRKLEAQEYLVGNKRFRDVLKLLLPDVNIEDLAVKFGAVAMDVRKKQEVVINKGPLIKAVMASSAIPGIFQPVNMDGALLIDGGWIDLIPVPASYKLRADKVIAVDIRKEHSLLRARNGLEFMNDASKVITDYFVDSQISRASLVLKVKADYEWYDFHDYKKLIEAGEKIAMENLPDIKRLFRQSRGFISLP
ncbi:MAG: patatin-like phospholipase family protein [bacterium]|nr:patatin-like phospholipase family protein [bacterium]